MITRRSNFIALFVMVLLTTNIVRAPAEEAGAGKTANTPQIGISDDVGKAAKREAAKVKEDIAKRTRSLFERRSLDWDIQTVRYLQRAAVSFPSKIPQVMEKIVKESKVLGALGSALILIFVCGILYSLTGQKRAIQWVEQKAQPIGRHIPRNIYPYFLALIKVGLSALLPMILFGLFSLIHKLIDYRAAWFLLTGRLLMLWAVGALLLRFLKEILTQQLFEVTASYGKIIFRYMRLLVLYIIIGMAVFWAAQAFHVRGDVMALIRFAVFVSVITVLFLLFLKKKAFLSLFPEISYRGYQWILNFIRHHYFLLLTVSYLAALGWCIGYHEFGKLVLTKIWLTLAALMAITALYHGLGKRLERWAEETPAGDETAQFLIRSIKAALRYATLLVAAVVVLNLLGLLEPLEKLMSFPIFQLGNTQVTPWIIIKAVVVLLAFVFISRLLQAYLDYRVYPAIGVDPGLGYALNTLFKYLSLAIGFFISISVVGIDLQFLLVFAGAAGIGIGLGLQNIAANIISGFTIIFGGKIRKGDWIEVNETLGVVTNIYLRATKVRSRDNIEYLIPNTDLISNTIINYSLSSPLIRIELPVGVSYSADPREVERIMLSVAEKEPLVSNYKKPLVRFVGYGDSSIDFHLLVWIDVREVPRRKVRSALYFAVWYELDQAGIEIPFPQRDIHIKSNG